MCANYKIGTHSKLINYKSNHMKILFLLILLLASCSQKEVSPTVENDKVMKIDMAKYQTISFDNLVEDIACTELKANPFDFAINLIPYEDSYYILGQTIAGKKISIFDKSGDLVQDITLSDAYMVNSMAIMPTKKELWCVSHFKNIDKFSLDGKHLEKKELPFACSNLIAVDSSNFLVYSSGGIDKQGNIKGYFMALTDFQTIHQLWMKKWGKKGRPYAPPCIFATDKSTVYIFPDKIDTIYHYYPMKREFQPLYKLDFHGDFLTKDKEPVGTHEDQEMDAIITQKKYIYAHTSFYYVSGHLLFKLFGKRDDFCMIDLQNHHLKSFSTLFDDYKSPEFNPIIGADNEHLYILIKRQELAAHYKTRTCSYNQIKRILSTCENNNNWILLTIKIKER